MDSKNPLLEWQFLVGRWKGGSKGEFGEEGEIGVETVFSFKLGERAILGEHTARKDGKILNQSISFLFYDVLEKTFRRKSLFSYGFVNNEVAYKINPKEIRFDVTSEPLPKQFEGIRWRSYLIKVSPTKLLMGLEQANAGEDFARYGETELVKIS